MHQRTYNKWIGMVLAATCVLALTACGADGAPENSGDGSSVSVSDVVTTTPTASITQTDATTSTTVVTDAITTTTTTAVTSTTSSATTTTTVKVTSSTTANRPQSTACPHSETKVKDAVTATCVKNGYSGDAYCSRCDALVKEGTSLPVTKHKNTEIRGKKEPTETAEGYGGDIYCLDCGNKIAVGNTVPKLEKVEENTDNIVQYIMPDGSILPLPEGTDITAYLMAQKTKKVSHTYAEIEKEILRLCNIEREKAGLKPLTWYEDAYCFTQTRAKEALESFSHTRPNGNGWSSVYTDAGVHLIGYSGENLYQSEGISTADCAKMAVEGWMNSAGHRANILSEKFNRIAIAIVGDNNELSIAQHFFS